MTGLELEFVLGFLSVVMPGLQHVPMSVPVPVPTSASMAVFVRSLCGLRLSAGDVLPVVLLVPELLLAGLVVTGAGTAGGLLGTDAYADPL